MIYFISNGTYTKIGKADNPEKRIKELQTGCPETLEIKLVIDGDEEKENMLHKALSKYRIRGEWFHLNFKYDEVLINDILYFYKKLNKVKKPKKIQSYPLICNAIIELKKENKFITIKDIANLCGISKSTVDRYYFYFKDDIDKYNLSVFNTTNYSVFTKNCSVEKITTAIKKITEEYKAKITQRSVAKESKLHFNTVCSLWNEEVIQSALKEYKKSAFTNEKK